MINYFAIACLLGIAAGAPYYGLHGLATDTSYSIPNYGFNYAVNDPHTGDNKAQTEIREGDVVKGSYSLAEPDGTIRIVDYTADPVSGFNAVVKRVGLGAHPQQLLTPVITKAVAAPVLASNPLFIPANIGYSDEDYYDHGLGWGDYDIGDHGSWHH